MYTVHLASFNLLSFNNYVQSIYYLNNVDGRQCFRKCSYITDNFILEQSIAFVLDGSWALRINFSVGLNILQSDNA